MTRAAERPAITDSEEARRRTLLGTSDGERPDSATSQALNLAHRAAEKFPELADRYKNFAGTAADRLGCARRPRGRRRRAPIASRPGCRTRSSTRSPRARSSSAATRHVSRKNRLWRMVLRIAQADAPKRPPSS